MSVIELLLFEDLRRFGALAATIEDFLVLELLILDTGLARGLAELSLPKYLSRCCLERPPHLMKEADVGVLATHDDLAASTGDSKREPTNQLMRASD